MPEEANGTGIPVRLDRVEKIVEALATVMQDLSERHGELQQEHKNLLSAQVVMSEEIRNLAAALRQLADAQRHADGRMDALILTVDEIIRGKKP